MIDPGGVEPGASFGTSAKGKARVKGKIRAEGETRATTMAKATRRPRSGGTGDDAKTSTEAKADATGKAESNPGKRNRAERGNGPRHTPTVPNLHNPASPRLYALNSPDHHCADCLAALDSSRPSASPESVTLHSQSSVLTGSIK